MQQQPAGMSSELRVAIVQVRIVAASQPYSWQTKANYCLSFFVKPSKVEQKDINRNKYSEIRHTLNAKT